MISARRCLPTFLVLLAAPLWAQSPVLTRSQDLPAQSLVAGSAAASIDLRNHFSFPGVTGQVVQYNTVLGRFNVELLSNAAPRHVTNFLAYVTAGAYANSFFHRSASFNGTNVAIVQGGGYRGPVANIATITKLAAVALEYNLPNTRGTLAAARTTDLNSATSEWYFNTLDNTTTLGPSNGGGYSVFGRVIGTGMTVVDAIAALPRFNAGSPFNEIPLRNVQTGQSSILDTNLITVTSIAALPVYPAGGSSVLTFTVQNSASAVVSATLDGSTLTLAPLAAGTATITVRATDTNSNAVESTVAVSVSSGISAPVFSAQPVGRTVATGSTVVLSAAATGATSFRWQRNGADVAGATNPTLVISGATTANAGSYTCLATNAGGTTTSNAAAVSVVSAAPADVGRLINLAIRTNAGTGAQTLIVGFAVGGGGTAGAKPLLVRGVGPTLSLFGLGGLLADPVATMFRDTAVVDSNDNWTSAAGERAAQVGAFALPAGSLDAALAVAPAPTSYTVQIADKTGGSGLALAEIYDASAAATFGATTPRLINVSARAQVETGGGILIAGFVVGGTTAKTVLIRAIGPTLGLFGVPGALLDPKLQLFSGDTVIAENDDWGGDAQLTSVGSGVGAFALPTATSKDAMLLVTLPPGSYTAQISGVGATTGVGLVELYEVP